MFSGQARPRPSARTASHTDRKNVPILRLSTPRVNAGRQKKRRRTRPAPFSPVRYLTETPLSDFAVSCTRRKRQLIRPIFPEGALQETVFFYDYASAGNTWHRGNHYRAWFPEEYGPTE